MKRRKKKKIKKNIKIIFIILIILLCFYFHKHNNKDELVINTIQNNEVEKEEKIKKEKEEKYNVCLKEKYNEDEDNEIIQEKKEELTLFIKKYNPGLYYLDPETGFYYIYNEDKEFYAASTIKMLDALYIYNNALNGFIDLDEEVKYKSSNYMGVSKKMKKYDYGDKIALRDLVEYAVTVSDNTAHNMLVEYIGFNNLKEYGKSLGATKTLVGGDIFGQINIDDAIIYLKELYRFTNEDNKYSEELKQIFLDSEQNYLDIPEENIQAAIKYGEYEYYYHENGIVYAKHPYLLSILSTIGKNEDAFRSINEKVYELHKTFYSEREKKCYSEIYEEN